MAVKLPQAATRTDDHDLRCRDARQKAAMKDYADHVAHATPSSLSVGDSVLLRHTGLHSKMHTPFEPQPYEIVGKKGSMITAKRGDRKVTRNSSFFKAVGAEVTCQRERQATCPPLHQSVIPVDLTTSDVEQELEVVAKSTGPVHDADKSSSAQMDHMDIPDHDTNSKLLSDPGPPLRRSSRTKEVPRWLNDFTRA